MIEHFLTTRTARTAFGVNLDSPQAADLKGCWVIPVAVSQGSTMRDGMGEYHLTISSFPALTDKFVPSAKRGGAVYDMADDNGVRCSLSKADKDLSELEPASNMSVCWWQRLTGSGSRRTVLSLMDRPDSNFRGWAVIYVSGKLRFNLWDGSSTVDEDYYESASFTVPGSWHHCALTYNQNRETPAQFFVNGALVSTDTTNDTPTPTATDSTNGTLYLGSTQTGNGHRGQLSDVRLYGRSLSQTEVQNIYANGWDLYQDSQQVFAFTIPDIVVATGGVEVNGAGADVTYHNPTTAGGAVLNGAATVQSSIVASGGIVVAGTASPSGSQSESGSGGVVLGGASTMFGSSSATASGGVIISQPSFGTTGYTHRLSITVPAGAVAEDISQYVFTIVATVKPQYVRTGTDFQVYNDSTAALDTLVRSYDSTTGKVVVETKTPLDADSTNSFYLYYGKD